MLVFYDEDLLTFRCISDWRTTSCLLYATAYPNLEAVSSIRKPEDMPCRCVKCNEEEEKENEKGKNKEGINQVHGYYGEYDLLGNQTLILHKKL
jgi:hypothetical protein